LVTLVQWPCATAISTWPSSVFNGRAADRSDALGSDRFKASAFYDFVRIGQEGFAMVKVFLVDDHEVVRRGLADLLASDPELQVIGDAGSVSEAKVRIAASKPDVAVLDVRLPDGSGIELCRDLLSDLPELRCLMLTSFTSDEAMLEAILAGASGYVIKDIRGMELAQAIKDVGAGKSLLDNRAAAALMAKLRGAAEHNDPLSGLTDRERTLLGLLSEGLTNRQIAARMFLAEKTVKNYVSRLLAKLGMERRTQAAVFASKLDQQSASTRPTTTLSD
jgi:two-component system response regulator DevR